VTTFKLFLELHWVGRSVGCLHNRKLNWALQSITLSTSRSPRSRRASGNRESFTLKDIDQTSSWDLKSRCDCLIREWNAGQLAVFRNYFPREVFTRRPAPSRLSASSRQSAQVFFGLKVAEWLKAELGLEKMSRAGSK